MGVVGAAGGGATGGARADAVVPEAHCGGGGSRRGDAPEEVGLRFWTERREWARKFGLFAGDCLSLQVL